MILVTVGTELPFNRMVKVVDEWAAETNRTDVFAQIGKTDWEPSHIQFSNFLDPAEYSHFLADAKVVIGHAGMGTILSALYLGKSILVMPRRASLREHRNEHQFATAQRLSDEGLVEVAYDDNELRMRLDAIDVLQPSRKIEQFAEPSLTTAIRSFIAEGHSSVGSTGRPFFGRGLVSALTRGSR